MPWSTALAVSALQSLSQSKLMYCGALCAVIAVTEPDTETKPNDEPHCLTTSWRALEFLVSKTALPDQIAEKCIAAPPLL